VTFKSNTGRKAVHAVLFVGIASAAALGTASADPLKTWRHGVIEPKSDAGFILMAAKGEFAEKQGLKIETVPLKSDALAIKALLAGELDSYEGGPGTAIAAASHGADVKVIGCAWPQPVHGIFVRSDIKDAKDLKGKRFAISAPGAFPDLLARATLEKGGVSPSDVQLANLGGDLDRYKALAAGVVDAAVVSTEYLPLADKNIKMLYTAREVMPDFIRTCTMTSGKVLSTKHDEAVHFIAAEISAMRYAVANKDKTVALTKEETQAKADDPRAAFLFDEVVKHGDLDPEMKIPTDKLDWLQNLMVKTGNLTKPADISKMVDQNVRTEAEKIVGGK